MWWLLWIPLALVLGFAAWVRLAPADTARLHVPPPEQPPGDYPTEGSFMAVRDLGDGAGQAMADLDGVIRATPRTRVLAGALSDGMVTYETRSRLWGFPDYTTVARDGGLLRIYGRLRFGKGDMGVNRARIEGWLTKLGGFSGP